MVSTMHAMAPKIDSSLVLLVVIVVNFFICPSASVVEYHPPFSPYESRIVKFLPCHLGPLSVHFPFVRFRQED